MADSIEHQDGCIFCSIAQGTDEKTVPLYKDEELIVFKDKKPAAPHHILVCPLRHIRDAKQLKRRHLDMVNRMVEVGKQVLEENCGDFSKARIGFHWPPFCSVYHLHLHVISPTDEIIRFRRIIATYNPKFVWFKNVDWLIERLQKMPEEDESRVVPQ